MSKSIPKVRVGDKLFFLPLKKFPREGELSDNRDPYLDSEMMTIVEENQQTQFTVMAVDTEYPTWIRLKENYARGWIWHIEWFRPETSLSNRERSRPLPNTSYRPKRPVSYKGLR